MTAMETKAKIPMEVEYPPAWLTWVASATGCLRALGVDCDPAEVAGLTGYAFMLSVHKTLCPSGPTMFDWGMLDAGVNFLGRSTEVFSCLDCHSGEWRCERTKKHCARAFELVVREVEAGRPCIIWGAYVPEFAIAYGVDQGKYLVKSFKQCIGQSEEPIAYDWIDAPGGPYVMAFPTPVEVPKRSVRADQWAIGHAVQLLHQRSPFSGYGLGLAAYEVWIQALAEKTATGFGNAYNAQCYAEGRAFARDYLRRVAERQPTVAAPIRRAAAAYEKGAEAMKRVAELYPFPCEDKLANPDHATEAIAALKEAKLAETAAAQALAEAVEIEWQPEAKAAEAG